MIIINNSFSRAVLTKAMALLLVVCLAECAAGSCLSYGHSCWGAHGKRSSGLPTLHQGKNEVVPVGDDRWFFLKLLRADGRRPPIDAINDNDLYQPHRRFKENDGSDERREYLAGKPISSEYSDEETQERLPYEAFMDDSRSGDKLNLLQILKDNPPSFP